MSGVETIIKYETSSTPKVVTSMMGVVVGIPFRVINKHIPIKWSEHGFEVEGGTHEYKLLGTHEIFKGLVAGKAKIVGCSLFINGTFIGKTSKQGENSIIIKAAVAEPPSPAVNATITEANIGTANSVLTIPDGGFADWSKVFTVQISMLILDESISEPKTIRSLDELVSLFGAEAVSNPVSNLAFGAYMYALGAVGQAFKILPVIPNASGLSLEECLSTTTSWSGTIKSFMEISNDTYHIVPLTDNNTILRTLSSDVESMSAPSAKKEFRAYVSHRIFANTPAHTACEDSIDAIMFSDCSSDVFLKGRDLILKGTNYEGSPMTFKTLLTTPSGKADFKELVKKAPANVDFSHRVTNIFPSYFLLEDRQLRVPGYMVAARICGERDIAALSTSFTYRPYPWIAKTPTLEMFKLSDFEEMVSWGHHVIVQETEIAIPRCYGESTCHIEMLEKAGENYVVSVDYLARRIRDHLIKYIANGSENKISSDPKDPATARYLKKVNSSLDFIKHEMITDKEVFSEIEISEITLGDGIVIPRNRVAYKLRVRLYYSVDEITVTIIVV